VSRSVAIGMRALIDGPAARVYIDAAALAGLEPDRVEADIADTGPASDRCHEPLGLDASSVPEEELDAPAGVFDSFPFGSQIKLDAVFGQPARELLADGGVLSREQPAVFLDDDPSREVLDDGADCDDALPSGRADRRLYAGSQPGGSQQGRDLAVPTS
jgi:hypothetical protein